MDEDNKKQIIRDGRPLQDSMRRIFCKNTHNWDAVQKTLDMLPFACGAHVVTHNGVPRLTADGLIEIWGNGFVEFALCKQGYADVVRSVMWEEDDDQQGDPTG